MASTTYSVQAAIHNSLPIVEEIIDILEKDEDEILKKEVDKRRTRLGAAGPEQIKKEVGREIWSTSRVRTSRFTLLMQLDMGLSPASCPL